MHDAKGYLDICHTLKKPLIAGHDDKGEWVPMGRLSPNRPLKKSVLGKRYEIVFTRKVNRGNMVRTPVAIWLFMQGYHSTSLPPVVTWYAPGREFHGGLGTTGG